MEYVSEDVYEGQREEVICSDNPKSKKNYCKCNFPLNTHVGSVTSL